MDQLLLQLEEVTTLSAYIAATPGLPFAHRAPHYAALATNALETRLVALETHGDTLDNDVPLKILRAIAKMITRLTLSDAVKARNIECVRLLLEEGEVVDDRLFCSACDGGHTEIVRLFLEPERGVNAAAYHNDAIRTASLSGHIEIVRMLLDLPLERGVNPAAENDEAISNASVRGHTEIMRLLLESERGVSPIYAFTSACSNGHTEIVRLLIDVGRGVNPGANENVALGLACERGHTEIVRLLLDLPLERGVHPAACDNDAIRSASYYGHTEIVRMLLDLPLERGVHPAACKNQAIKYAIANKHTDIVSLLQNLPPERGINANEIDDEDRTSGGLGWGDDDDEY